MRVEVEAGSPESVESDVLAAPLLAEEGPTGPLSSLNDRLGGLLGRLAEQGEITGKLKTAPVVHVDGELKADRLALPGIGAREAVDADALRTAAGTLAREARGYARTIAWLLDDSLPLEPAEQARAIVDGTLLGAYDPGRWKSSTRAAAPRVARHRLRRRGGRERPRTAPASSREWTNRARDLANAPPNELTPDGLADRAAEVAVAGSPHLSVEAPGLDEIRALGMGAFAAVAQGSHNPAAADRAALRASGAARRGRARPRRQGSHLRHRRHLDQEGALHGGHERRHGRRRRRDRRTRRARRARVPAPGRRRRRRDRERGRRRRVPAGRHPHGHERQDDRDHQHRRRGPARARRRPPVRAAARRHAPRRLRHPDRRDGASRWATSTPAVFANDAGLEDARRRGRRGQRRPRLAAGRSIRATGASSTPTSPT